LEVLREVYGLEEGIWSAEALQPDLIIVSTELAGTRLVGLITDLRTHSSLSKVVAVGEVLEPETHRQLAAVGLDGHLVWNDLRSDAVLYGIGAVLDGNLMIASRRSVAQLLHDTHQVTAPSPQLALAEDERRVLERLAEGLTQREISEIEHMSLR